MWYHIVMTPDDIIFIIVLIYSIILHEIAHGYVAYREGDNTAKWAGRLTLNPLPHIDPIGSILIPILSYIGAGAAFGWAKGVPYNPHMLRHKYSEAKVAVAGVATNFALAIIAAAIFYFTKSFNTGLGFDLLSSLINILNTFLVYVVIINNTAFHF